MNSIILMVSVSVNLASSAAFVWGALRHKKLLYIAQKQVDENTLVLNENRQMAVQYNESIKEVNNLKERFERLEREYQHRIERLNTGQKFNVNPASGVN